MADTLYGPEVTPRRASACGPRGHPLLASHSPTRASTPANHTNHTHVQTLPPLVSSTRYISRKDPSLCGVGTPGMREMGRKEVAVVDSRMSCIQAPFERR